MNLLQQAVKEHFGDRAHGRQRRCPLSWLESAQHEFEALVRKVLGAEVAETIGWRRPRTVCIATGFSHHDRVAVRRLPERIDLVRYLISEGGLLGLLLVDAAPGIPSAASPRQSRERATVIDSTPAAPASPSTGRGQPRPGVSTGHWIVPGKTVKGTGDPPSRAPRYHRPGRRNFLVIE